MTAIGALTLLSCVGIVFVYISGEPGSSLTPTGFVAMAIGLLAAIMLGTGLALLVLNDRRGDE